LNGLELDSPEGQIKHLREEVRELDSSILYLQGQQDLTASQSTQSEQAARSLNDRLAALRQEQAGLEQKRFRDLDVSAMQSRLVELSAQYSDLSGDVTEDPEMTSLNERILELGRQLGERQGAIYEPKYTKSTAETAERVRTLGEQYQKEASIFNNIVHQRICPTCRRPVADADIPTMKESFQKSLGEIVAAGKEQRSQLDELNALEQKAQDTFQKFKQEDIARLEAELEQAKQKRDQAYTAASESAAQERGRMEQVRGEIQSITSDLEYGNLSTEEYDRLKTCGDEIRQAEAELAALQKTAAMPTENYADKIQTAKASIREKKDQINSLQFYLSKRAELTFEQLHMNRVSISLYDVVKTTGEYKDVFKFTYNGRRYDRLSLSEKIRAGMEVSELMKKLTGRNYPVFVDNMESVDDLANVRPTGQVIMARCVRNAALEVKAVTPIPVQMPQAA
jgi:chromosome segregation ATPase